MPETGAAGGKRRDDSGPPDARERAAERPPTHVNDMPRERLEWRVQRAGWFVAMLVIVAAVAGVFGDGPLSFAGSASADGALRVSYQRFLRKHAPAELVVEAAGTDPELALSLENGYLERIGIRCIVPEPLRQEARGDETRFVFRAGAGERARITIHVEPQRPGRARTTIRTSGGAAVELSHFIWL